MAGPNYISNPALWEQFRHTEDGKDFIPAIRRHVQRGGGILNRRRAYMIPVKKSAPIPQVTPVEADRERALSDLKETIRNEEPHMPLKKPIKRKKTPKNRQSLQDFPRERTQKEERSPTCQTFKKENNQENHFVSSTPQNHILNYGFFE